jgi:hypothetical protein
MKMKKHFLICLLAGFMFSAAAQEITGLRGQPILPEKGDWCLAFDAAPFLLYSGNLLNHSPDNSAHIEFPNGYENTLVLKKFKESNRALRFKIRVGFFTEKIDTVILGLGSTNPEPSVTDSKTISEQHFAFGVGFQKSGGKGRLRANRGLELLIKYSSRTTTYTYGDGALTSLVWIHTNTFGQGAGVMEVKDGNQVGFNIRYVIGAEYFFAPKMSLSAEYSWGINYFAIGEATTKSERWDFATNKVKTTTKRIPRQPSFKLDNFYDAASINLSIYFGKSKDAKHKT